VVVVVAMGLWMWLRLWLPFWVCLGDAACHVINVGTCCPNLYNHKWPSSSAVKHPFIVTTKVRGSNPQKNKCFFALN
jgi:hypothetical protein